MTVLTLNSDTFTISGYDRYTTIDEQGNIQSYASVGFPNNSQYNALVQVGEIESLSIAIDGTTVYSLPETSARITNIAETLYDRGVAMTATITFDIAEE